MISKLRENKFDVVVIPRWGNKGYNRMHDKFCIIDMDYVMHGSYNWTPRANNNEEPLAAALNHELVAKFAKELMDLYNGNYFYTKTNFNLLGENYARLYPTFR